MEKGTVTLLSQGVYADIVLAQSRSQRENLASSKREEQDHNNFAVIKVVQAPRNGIDSSRIPHNIVLEVRTLKQVDHPNIVQCLGYEYSPERSLHELYLPLLAFPLADLLDNPLSDQDLRIAFSHLAQQALAGLAHLHGWEISHRDINPRNIMIDWNATLVFIDFSTAFAPTIYSTGEEAGSMVCQVGTGPYRAPELLFGAEKYDPKAIDLWAIGTVLAEFFLSDQSDYEDVDEDPLEETFDQFESRKRRSTLFDATFGDLGLAASIFRVRGSPRYSWTEFHTLPDSDKVSFEDVPPLPLRSNLPRLGCMPGGGDLEKTLEGLLALSPFKRLTAVDALDSLDSDIERGTGPDTLVKSIFYPYFETAKDRIRCSITTEGR